MDIYFNSTIARIEPAMKDEIDWKDIATREDWLAFQEEIPEQKFPPQLKIYDGKFMILIPGAIDAHVHFNTPGFERRETFETGTSAAAHGGVTTVIDMPCTSLPPVTSVLNFKKKLNSIKNQSWVDFVFWGGVNGSDFEAFTTDVRRQIYELAKFGVAGFKAYLISDMKTFTDMDFPWILQTAKWVKRTGKPLAVHAEDKLYVIYKRRRYKDMWLNDWRAYCNARDDVAEAKAVAMMIEICRRSECPIHIVHLSSELGLEMVRKAKLQGLPMTAETCPHYLFFTQNDFANKEIANYLKTAPPVKNENDRAALWDGLKDSTISFITTDHAGCDPIKDKSHWDFWEVISGIPGVEHRVPFLFSEGFLKNRLTVSQTIELLATNPAKFFGLDKTKGSLQPGMDADMALINLWDKQTITASNMHCKGKYTPFEGVTFNAVVEQTFLRGRRIMQRNSEPEAELGYGRLIRV